MRKIHHTLPGIILLSLVLSFTAYSNPRPPLPPWPESTLGIWGFNEIFTPALPMRTALGTQNAQFQESWSG